MRFIICASCVAVLVASAMAMDPETPTNKPYYDLNDAPNLFEKFIKDYNRNYSDAEDRKIHYEAFYETLKNLNEYNTNPNYGSAVFDINDFADYTKQQRMRLLGALPSNA